MFCCRSSTTRYSVEYNAAHGSRSESGSSAAVGALYRSNHPTGANPTSDNDDHELSSALSNVFREGDATSSASAGTSSSATKPAIVEGDAAEAVAEDFARGGWHRAVLEDAQQEHVSVRGHRELPTVRLPGDELRSGHGDVAEGGRRQGAGLAHGLHTHAVHRREQVPFRGARRGRQVASGALQPA